MSSPFSSRDLAFIRARGGRIDYVERQLEILGNPPPPVRLLRPCRLDDGIKKLTPRANALRDTWKQATDRRLLKFVPASGVASRMFSFLPAPLGSKTVSIEALRSGSAQGDSGSELTLQLLDEIEALAVFPDLERLVRERTGRTSLSLREDDPGLLLALLVDSDGLGLGALPKGLLPFHRYGEITRTAFEEHLVEGARYASADASSAMYHFTVSAEHEHLFRQQMRTIVPVLEKDLDRKLEVGFSNQQPSTDTIAIDARDEPVRDANGDLLFRPGGHGSLLANLALLAEAGHDLVFVKNIDNVPAERDHQLVVEWKQILAGHTLELQRAAFELLDQLEQEVPDPETVTRAAKFIQSEFAIELPDHFREMPYAARAQLLVDRLDRPLRIAGVVLNRGEPGGGPFWVARVDGSIDGQIIESAQVNWEDPEQERIWSASTHFNPVDIVCAPLDRNGRSYNLQRFIDQSTYFVTSKDHEGETIRVLERPGLWNGAMAAWNTAFIEVPEQTFSPVKTLADLLRPAHRT